MHNEVFFKVGDKINNGWKYECINKKITQGSDFAVACCWWHTLPQKHAFRRYHGERLPSSRPYTDQWLLFLLWLLKDFQLCTSSPWSGLGFKSSLLLSSSLCLMSHTLKDTNTSRQPSDLSQLSAIPEECQRKVSLCSGPLPLKTTNHKQAISHFEFLFRIIIIINCNHQRFPVCKKSPC